MMQTMAKTGEIPLQTTKTAALDFAGLVGQHQSMVFSIALHFLRDRPAAEELAQDVFLQLHHSLAELESADHVTFWLRRVTSHRCIDHARRRKMPAISLDEAEWPELAAEVKETDLLLTQKLRQAMGSLPEKQRLVMVLRYQEEMTPDEIGAALGMPVATVRSHMRRSLLLLREKLTRMTGGTR